MRFLSLILVLEGVLCVSLLSSEAFYSAAPPASLEPPPISRIPARTPVPPPVPAHLQSTGEPAPTQVRELEKLHIYSFDGPEPLSGWEEKVFKGRTEYRAVKEGEGAYLSAASTGASSGLFMKLDQEVTPGTMLIWKWRASDFPKKPKPDRLADRSQDDFAARLYAIFPGPSYFKTDVIEYLWDGDIEGGTVSSSPFSGKVKLFVIRKGPGPGADDGWVSEERDLYQDYVDLFGKKPKRPLGAIAIMSDSDNTNSSSRADFGTIEISRLKEGGEKP